MRLLKNLLVGLIALLMLAMLTVYLTPLDAYVPRMEQALAKRLDEPVDIERVKPAMLPLPHLELVGVRLGKRETIAAQSVDVELDLPTLVLERRAVVRRISVRDGAAHLELLRKLAELFADQKAVVEGIAVRELDLSGMSLLAGGAAIGPLEGRLVFGPKGRLQSALLSMDERKMTAELVPMPERRLYMLVQAREWTPPRLPQLPDWRMDSLQLEGVLSERDFIALKFTAAARGISLAGSGKVEFADGWRVRANVHEANTTLERLMALLGSQAGLTGIVSVKGKLSARARVAGELGDSLHFNGEVRASQVSARIAAGFQRPFVLDEIGMRLDAEPDHLMLSGLQAKLYGGSLTGEASMDRKKAVLAASFSASGIAMRPMVEALTNEVLVTGTMNGSAKFDLRLKDFERFPENMRSAGSFHMRNGTLTKVDLVQVANNPGTIYTKGGVTRFDDLTGLFKVDGGGYHFRDVKISSGSLNAEGSVDITPSWQLKGMLEADVKGTAGLVSMPMTVSGTVSDPVVRPSGSALAGAAVGTAILGPGLGTAVGIRVGGFLNKLFGRNEDKNKVKEAARANPPGK